MKKATIVGVSIAAVPGLAGMAQTAVNGGLSSLNTQVQSIPEEGSTLLVLGTGLLALAAWHRWSRGGMAA